MYEQARAHLQATLDEIRAAGLWKHERIIASPQGAHIVSAGKEVLNFCANNYLGLADDPALVTAALLVQLRDRRGRGSALLAGLPLKTQGLLLGSSFALTNAMDLVIGN